MNRLIFVNFYKEWHTQVILLFEKKQNEWSLYRVLSTGSKVIMNRITPITSTLQDKQNECFLYGFINCFGNLEITLIISFLQDEQNEWLLYRVLSTDSKVRRNNTSHSCTL